MIRTIPPVHSPLNGRALWQSGLAALGGQHAAPARVEALLRLRHDAREVLLTDSGTSALGLALRLAAGLRLGGGAIALPAWGCYDLATAADFAGLDVLLYDLDPATLGPDWASLDRVLDQGVAAVVLVHFFGVPIDADRATLRAQAAGAIVIEDAAQAIGTRLGDRPAGTSGALGVLSFGRGKGWTCGGGGALLLNRSAPAGLTLDAVRPSLAAGGHLAAALKLFAQWTLARPAIYALPASIPFLRLGQTIYHPPAPAAMMSRGAAAVLQSTEPLQLGEASLRAAHARRLARAVQQAGLGITPAGWMGGEPGWLRLPVMVAAHSLERVAGAEARRLGIITGYPLPLVRLPGFSGRVRNAGPWPGAEALAENLFTFPTHSQLTEADLGAIEAWIRRS